jgi:lysophospholipase L1-like esterase
MEYGFFEPVEWPLASTIASVVGVLMVLGQHAGQVAGALAELAVEDLRRALTWLARPWLACVALIAVPVVAPDWPPVQALRGSGRLDAELEMARADGYYERLVQSPGERHQPRTSEPPPGYKPFAESGVVAEVADYRRRLLRPNLDVRWNGTTFRTNDLGYRGPPISRGKPPGTFRVVVLGSSNSMGHGIEDEETYARLLERWLARRARPGGRVEVVNMAVSGDSPTQRLRRLQLDVSGLDPDWILSDITALDLSLEEQHLRWVVGKGIEVPLDFVRAALSGSGVDADDSPGEFHQKFRPYLKPLLDRTFAGWASEANRLGVPLTVVILPRADSKTESPGVFRLLREAADRHDLRLCDLSTAFDQHDLDDYRISPWDLHPNAYGHRLIFDGLRDGLMADPDFLR